MASKFIGEILLLFFVLMKISFRVSAVDDGMIDYEAPVAKVNQQKWPEAVVPYIIDESLSSGSDISLLMDAMDNIEQNTCIVFMPRTDQENYIKFDRDNGCYSNVAMVGGEQIVSVGRGCEYIGTVLSLLANALGLQHEHNSPDRDDHLVVHWENINPIVWNQFVKLDLGPYKLLTSMDQDSITMYGAYSFSKNGEPIMESIDGRELPEVYEKTSLSPGDIEGIKGLYHC